jgi:hypothetical protein
MIEIRRPELRGGPCVGALKKFDRRYGGAYLNVKSMADDKSP